MAFRGLFVGCIGVGAVLVAASAYAQADAAEVEALIAKGNELRRAGTPGPALPYFRRAYELARTPRTNGQLGLAELAAGYPVEAEQHLATALESPNDPGIVKYQQMLKDALTMARSQIGELAIQGSPTGAEVIVNGRLVGALPLEAPIKLVARTTEVVVRAPGHTDRREMVPIAGGQRHALNVKLEPVAKAADSAPVVTAAPVPSATPPPAAPTPLVVQDGPADTGESGFSLRTAAWVAGGAALVAGGAGLVLHLAARSKAAEINSRCEDPSMPTTPISDPLSDADCQDRLDTWDSYKRWSMVGYISGAALAVTSGILFWTSRPSTTAPTSSGLQAGIHCAPTPTGISCHGTF
jgi:hypothetical protein